MALVVEDGTGKATANTYISESDADTYHSDRGNSAWAAATTAAKQAALITATQYLDGRYRGRWTGRRTLLAQALAWPRYNAYDADGFVLSAVVPTQVARATAEAALYALSNDLTPELDRGGAVSREKVGPIEISYQDAAPARTRLTVVDDLLRGLVRYAGQIRVTR